MADAKEPGFRLNFGIIADPFGKQLKKQGYRIKRGFGQDLARLDEDNEHICSLKIRGYLTQKGALMAYKKLAKKVVACAEWKQ